MSGIEPIGQKIKRERLSHDMTQRILAEKVGVGAPHISKIEAGRESPSDELLQKIAEALGCDFDELLLAARRIPPDLMDTLASDPQRSLEFLRQWKARET
jgi:transcriptional regulator with XRE-family HTH domain